MRGRVQLVYQASCAEDFFELRAHRHIEALTVGRRCWNHGRYRPSPTPGARGQQDTKTAPQSYALAG
jgi:hypothetical protein